MPQQHPGNTGVLVSQRHGGKLGRLGGYEGRQPWVRRAAPLGVAWRITVMAPATNSQRKY